VRAGRDYVKGPSGWAERLRWGAEDLHDEAAALLAQQKELRDKASPILVGCKVIVQKGQLLPRLKGRTAIISGVIFNDTRGLMVLLKVPKEDGSGFLDTGPSPMRTYIPIDSLVFSDDQ
jgi:hypothetical protein